MKIILLFDSDKLDNVYREYELNEALSKELSIGGRVVIDFCHPDRGEIFQARIEHY